MESQRVNESTSQRVNDQINHEFGVGIENMLKRVAVRPEPVLTGFS
ncbi:MAG: hypothetical protein ABIG63_09120 [Chloroflexota bacterium]